MSAPAARRGVAVVVCLAQLLCASRASASAGGGGRRPSRSQSDAPAVEDLGAGLRRQAEAERERQEAARAEAERLAAQEAARRAEAERAAAAEAERRAAQEEARRRSLEDARRAADRAGRILDDVDAGVDGRAPRGAGPGDAAPGAGGGAAPAPAEAAEPEPSGPGAPRGARRPVEPPAPEGRAIEEPARGSDRAPAAASDSGSGWGKTLALGGMLGLGFGLIGLGLLGPAGLLIGAGAGLALAAGLFA